MSGFRKTAPKVSKAQPLRTLSKADSRRLPQSKKVQYLFDASVAMSSRNPTYSSYLGRRCVGEMKRCVQPHGLSRVDMARLCRQCGCAYDDTEGYTVRLSKSTVRRSQRGVAKATNTRGKGEQRVVRAGIQVQCRVCGNEGPVWKYPNEDVAARVLENKKGKQSK